MKTALTPKQEARRDRVLEAAATAAMQGGYDAVQMRDVAAEAEVALGTLYRYFASKDQLLVAVMGQWTRQLQGQLARRPAQGATAADRVIEAIRRAVKAMEREPLLTTAVVTALTSLSADDPQALAYADDAYGVLTEIVTAAMDGEHEDSQSIVRVLSQVWFASLIERVRGWGRPGDMLTDLETAVRLLVRD